MPTSLDRAINSNSKNFVLGFAGMVTAVAAWSIWGSEIASSEKDPSGNPDDWTADEMRTWLRLRGLFPTSNATRDELLERVKANLRAPPKSSEQAKNG